MSVFTILCLPSKLSVNSILSTCMTYAVQFSVFVFFPLPYSNVRVTYPLPTGDLTDGVRNYSGVNINHC